jgi:hypothetical protein
MIASLQSGSMARMALRGMPAHHACRLHAMQQPFRLSSSFNALKLQLRKLCLCCLDVDSASAAILLPKAAI